MELLLAAVGTRMPRWVGEGFEVYRRRLPPTLRLELREIPVAARRAAGDVPAAIDREGKGLLRAATGAQRIVAFDERGRAMSTRDLAAAVEGWQQEGLGRVAFLVGGPDGLSADCRQGAAETWSLSPLTLPHALVRVVVAEQLYRAWTILSGHPYHRD